MFLWGGIVMKKYEVRSMGIWSLFKFYAIVGFIIATLILFISLTAGNYLAKIGLELFNTTQAISLSTNFFQGLLACLLYGVVSGVIAALGGVIYNVFAAAVGGIIITLKDEL